MFEVDYAMNTGRTIELQETRRKCDSNFVHLVWDNIEMNIPIRNIPTLNDKLQQTSRGWMDMNINLIDPPDDHNVTYPIHMRE